jgi:hypothetical protein
MTKASKSSSLKELKEGHMIKEISGAGDWKVLRYCCDFCDFCSIYKPLKDIVGPIMECDACGRHVCAKHRVIKRVREPDDMRIYSIECYCLECWETRKEQDELSMPPSASHIEQAAPYINGRA